jgi:Putative outer membrane beta-barrel porin, MtrB/PioB
MLTAVPREDMTLTGTLRADWNQYPTDIGRQGYDTYAAMLQWEWQPAARSNVSLWMGFDHSSLHMANVRDATDTPDATLGGATYPQENRWWANDEERNWSAGAALSHQFGIVRADLGWNYLSSRGITRYSFASAGALSYTDIVDTAGSEFPAMTYNLNSFTLSVTVPIADRISLRLFDYYEHGQVGDWHYAGFNNTLVYGNRVYTDGGPQSYNTNLLGLFVNVRL